jgi:hypothetical protein
MISYQQGKPHIYPLSHESSVFRSTLRARPAEDYAFSANWLHVQRQLSLMPYIVELQTQINMLKEKLETLERERDELLAGSLDENVMALELEVESTRSGRIVEEIDAPFYYFGGEGDE